MKITLPVLILTVLNFTSIAQANMEPLKAPDLFDNGPAAIAVIHLNADEKAVMVLLDSAMNLAKSAVLAAGCESVEGSYSIESDADGAVNKPVNNSIKITSTDNAETLVLHALMESPDSFRGQTINIRQTKDGKFKETRISEYSGVATFNHESTLLSMQSRAKVLGQTNTFSPQSNFLLKHFYEESNTDNKTQYLLGWGTASVLKEEFPVNKFWLRTKALKADGKLKRIILQEDRLIGTSSCRIVVDSIRDNKKVEDEKKEKQPNLVFKGTMTISKSHPNENLPKENEF